MRITCVIHSLDGGGAEMTMAKMVNHWSEEGHDVTLITLDRAGVSRYPVSEKVRWCGLDLMHESRSLLQAVTNNWTRRRALRDAISESTADIVISFTDQMNTMTLLACRRLDVPVVVCERVDPRHHPLGRVWSWLRRRTYGRSAAIIVQTESVQRFIEEFAPRTMIETIPNCLWPDSIPDSVSSLDQRPKRILGLGRLEYQKGFDRLIEAFTTLSKQLPDWTLTIAGDGSELEHLSNQIQRAGLSDRIELLGWKPNVQELFAESQLFVLSSRYEGFPNALLEAMACGCAVVSFDCDSGPREIIRDRIDGLLVKPDDVGSLASCLSELTEDSQLRQQLATQAVEVKKRFGAEAFFEQWDKLLAKHRQ